MNNDKQFIGYVNKEGRKFILIQLLDFSEDPYHLKPSLKNSWIDGWHGWYETNVHRLHYNVENGAVTINEDL